MNAIIEAEKPKADSTHVRVLFRQKLLIRRFEEKCAEL
jgi:hypothetical protein